jgi:hypothetical protein
LLAFHDRQLTDRREATLLSLYLTLIHFGGIIVPPGYTAPSKFLDGNPYGASLVTTHDNINEFDQVFGRPRAPGAPGGDLRRPADVITRSTSA